MKSNVDGRCEKSKDGKHSGECQLKPYPGCDIYVSVCMYCWVQLDYWIVSEDEEKPKWVDEVVR